MQPIEKLAEFLNQYPFVKYERRENAIRAFPTSEKGFDVTLLVNPGSYTVCYALWHTEFADEHLAVNAFKNGLSDTRRLRVTSRAVESTTVGGSNFERLADGLAAAQSGHPDIHSGRRR